MADYSVFKCVYKQFHLYLSSSTSLGPSVQPPLPLRLRLHRSCRGLALEQATGFGRGGPVMQFLIERGESIRDDRTRANATYFFMRMKADACVVGLLHELKLR